MTGKFGLGGSSIHGIFQARVLEWGAIAFSDDQPRQHIKKQRHYFANKGPSSQGYGFSVVMYGCESWTVKKAECRKIDAFELCHWRRFFRVPWTARRSNKSILKEIRPGCSLEGMMLKLKLQYFGHLMRRVDSLDPCVPAKSLQSCLTLCNPMDCSLPGSSVHGILQARILK